MIGEIVLPRRSFTDVHELVYLFQSWQLLLESEAVPEPLTAIQALPAHLEPVMADALAAARTQLESAQAGTEITLRLAATPEFVELMRWGSDRLAEIAAAALDGVDPNLERALVLAKEFVAAALEQLNLVVPAD
jgi:hypothetical protein